MVFVGAAVLAINLITSPNGRDGGAGAGWRSPSPASSPSSCASAGRRTRCSTSTSPPAGSSGWRPAPASSCSARSWAAVFVGQQFVQNVLGFSSLEAGLTALPAAVFMVLIAPRSAKLVDSRGARFTLLVGYVFCFLAFLTMLLLWRESTAACGRSCSASRSWASASRFAGTPASHSLTGSVPVRRAGMASATADLQRDLGGADHAVRLRRAAHGGVRLGDGGQHRVRAPNADADQRRHAGAAHQVVRRRARASPSSTRSTRSRSPRRRGRRSCTATGGPTPPARWPSSAAPSSSSSASPRGTTSAACWRSTGRRMATPGRRGDQRTGGAGGAAPA